MMGMAHTGYTYIVRHLQMADLVCQHKVINKLQDVDVAPKNNDHVMLLTLETLDASLGITNMT